MTYSPAYEAGKIAALIGWDAINCPHAENSDEARQWLLGWSDGRRELKARAA